MQRREFIKMVGGAVVSAVPSAATRAQSGDPIADFYHGKTLRIMVGAPAGGGYDLTARIIANRLGAHIPGNPNVIVENIPTASGLVMANNLYNIAPRDGTTIGLPPNAIALEPRLKTLTRAGGNASFDVAKFSWLGTAARQPQVFFVWHKTGIENAQELKTKKVIVAAISVGSDAYVLPAAMNRILDGKMQIVTGYHGLDDTLIAIERGEAEGANTSFAGLLANKPDWIRDKLAHILIQFGRDRLPLLPDVPTAIELATDPRDKAALKFYSSKYDVAYALIAPPDVPAERIQSLRRAFEETMKDPEYVAAAKRMQLPLNSLNGEAVSKIIADIEATPQDIVDHMRALMDAKLKG